MKNFLALTLISLLAVSCAHVQREDFSKRKYLRLSKNQISETTLTHDSTKSEPLVNSYVSIENRNSAEMTSRPSTTYDVAPSEPELLADISLENSYQTAHLELDDSLTVSGEDPVAYAIKDQMKIMNPYFKWSKIMLWLSLILAAALVTLFFILPAGTLVAELLYVLLIFDALFSIIGMSSAIRSRVSAKKLQGLSKDETQLKRTEKVRNVTKWVLLFFILIPVLGLAGLIVSNNT